MTKIDLGNHFGGVLCLNFVNANVFNVLCIILSENILWDIRSKSTLTSPYLSVFIISGIFGNSIIAQHFS